MTGFKPTYFRRSLVLIPDKCSSTGGFSAPALCRVAPGSDLLRGQEGGGGGARRPLKVQSARRQAHAPHPGRLRAEECERRRGLI